MESKVVSNYVKKVVKELNMKLQNPNNFTHNKYAEEAQRGIILNGVNVDGIKKSSGELQPE